MEWNPGPRVARPSRCRVLFTNINGLHGNLRELDLAAKGFDVVVCAETKATRRRHAAELLLTGFDAPTLLPRGSRPNGLGLALYVRKRFTCTRQRTYECNCCEVVVARVCGARSNFYLFFVYRSPNTDDRVYDCLLESMGRIQSEDPKSVFLFAGDFNSHHMEWLGSPRNDNHGVAAHNFSSLSDCTQLVRGPTHVGGGVLDLVLTNVPDLCRVVVGGPIGKSDHSHIDLTLNTSARAPGFDCSHEVLLKTRVNWDVVRAEVAQLPWGRIYRSDTMVEDLETHLHGLVERHVPRVTVRRRMGDQPWFTADCRTAFEQKQTAYFRWCRSRDREDWWAYRQAQRAANACYEDARSAYSERCREKLANTTSSHAWWGTLKESVFGVDPSIPALQGVGGALVSDPAEKAELLSTFFDSKQSRDPVALPHTCHPSPRLSSFAFRSREVRNILLELDPNGGVDPLGYFPLLFKELAPALSTKICTVFRRLLREGSFPIPWRCANVTPTPKGPLSSLPSGYRPISITPVLSKVFEKLLARRLGCYMETEGIFHEHQFAYRKGLGTCDALLDVVCSGQAALERNGEVATVQIDFSAAFDRVNHAGLMFKLQDAGVGGVFLDVIRCFLTDRVQRVKVDGALSGSVGIVSGVPQGSVLGPLLFLLYTGDLPRLLENKLVGYADDSTLMAYVARPADRPAVTASINRDLVRIGDWCRSWAMLVNPSKTKALIFSRSRTENPHFPDLILNGTIVEVVKELRILGVILDPKLSFKSHISSVVALASSKLGILRKALQVYQLPALVSQCFWSFLLPVLEYCSPVWMSACATDLRLLDRIVTRAGRLCNNQIVCNLNHRRNVASLCMFYKVWNNPSHPVRELIPPLHVPLRATRRTISAHRFTLDAPRVRTCQFANTFIPVCVGLWNALDDSCFAGEWIANFKTQVNRFLLLH